jgi:hypothetical protein
MTDLTTVGGSRFLFDPGAIAAMAGLRGYLHGRSP